MDTCFLWAEKCFWHTGQPHVELLPVGGWVQPTSTAALAESPETKRRLKSLVDASGLAERLDVRVGKSAEEIDLLRVHPPDYLSRFLALSDAGGGSIGPDATFGSGGYEIAKLSAGLACEAVERVVSGLSRNAYALSRPPGHHCLVDQPMGFCLLANVAIAVEQAKARHGISRVAVLDWDVHHGNGTEAIFYDRPDVFTISVHEDGCYPLNTGGAGDRGAGRGCGYNLNIPLLSGGGDQAYRDAFEMVIAPSIIRYKPELIVVACGFDASAVDPLARMQLHSESFAWLTRSVMALADDYCSGRLVMVHEGGYSQAYVPFCGLKVLEALSGTTTHVADPLIDFLTLRQPKADFNQFQRERLAEQARSLFGSKHLS